MFQEIRAEPKIRTNFTPFFFNSDLLDKVSSSEDLNTILRLWDILGEVEVPSFLPPITTPRYFYDNSLCYHVAPIQAKPIWKFTFRNNSNFSEVSISFEDKLMNTSRVIQRQKLNYVGDRITIPLNLQNGSFSEKLFAMKIQQRIFQKPDEESHCTNYPNAENPSYGDCDQAFVKNEIEKMFGPSQGGRSWRASGDRQISLNASAQRAFANFRDKKNTVFYNCNFLQDKCHILQLQALAVLR